MAHKLIVGHKHSSNVWAGHPLKTTSTCYYQSHVLKYRFTRLHTETHLYPALKLMFVRKEMGTGSHNRWFSTGRSYFQYYELRCRNIHCLRSARPPTIHPFSPLSKNNACDLPTFQHLHNRRLDSIIWFNCKTCARHQTP